MTVKVRPYKRSQREGWEVDICVNLPNGEEVRERRRAPVATKSQAQRWGERREHELLREALSRPAEEPKKKEVPTLTEFAPRFIESYAEANRQKPSGIDAKKRILRLYLEPDFGSKKLDQIKTEDVQRFKARLGHRSAKTVNNILSVLGKLLRVAVSWEVIHAMPCRIELLKAPKPEKSFLDFDDLDRLVEGATMVGWGAHLLVLLGADAGLRRGEMISLRWNDVDFVRRELHIRRADWKGIESTPKGGRGRTVDLTKRLLATLKAYRHLRSERVLCEDDGKPITGKTIARWMRQATRRAGLAVLEGPHILRHTFCSHLAMRGATVMAIKELAGHRDVSTTMGYMHLSPSAKRGAIELLDGPAPSPVRGEILEQPGVGTKKSSRSG
ncbi:tyrosine-type recombinase/integrase [Polyangium jinanense]|uniref:Tyrosine-type recombinase/integrase n=1 Tax=Polyangium jinanense TaxID=2829994 RepID=A0A9X3XGJ8_9BACT|nr:site-specific integrase [Polyangium jinanense]MDC3958524.1 tyrosine-type recombinase/integrase [Polyangium jinanense]MDC3988990.1 tyrosine-type recombinase/integrase [Polyangium jinanense]